ncbi:MAG: respiratory nitrate reductase subunit gamma [Thermoleophilia bacterium]
MTVLFVVLGYAALAIFLVGVLAKVWKYGTTPAPLKIPQTPAPVTAAGVPGRMLSEVVLFKSLFKSNRVIWLAGYVFHIGLLLALVKHYRFLFASVPAGLSYFDTFEMYPGIIMMGGLGLLFLLRLVVDRNMFISVMTDYILILLFISIALTGTLAKHFYRVDISQVKQFMMGLISFNPMGANTAFPTETIFIIHFSLVLFLLVYFPFSKLMHAAGVFFSPTRNQVDNPREKRLVAPWATDVSGNTVVTVKEEAAEVPGQA